MSDRPQGFTLIELLIVIFSLCGLIGGLGEGWKFGLGWSLLYALIGLFLGLSIIVVPIFALGTAYHAFQAFFGRPDEGREAIDPSENVDRECDQKPDS